MAETRRNAADGDLDRLRRRANRRLLGAAVLLLVAIIAVPLLLEREPPLLPETVEVRIPPIEGTSFEHKLDANKSAKVTAKDSTKAAQPALSKPPEPPAIQEPSGERAATPAPTPSAGVPPAPSAVAAPAATSAASAAAPVTPPATAPAVSPKPPAKTATAPAAATESTTPRKAGQLVVQIIAVRDPAAAKMVADRARGLKYPVYTERIDVANGVVTRVRVGPYDTKQAAEAARARLARDGFEAKVVTLQ